MNANRIEWADISKGLAIVLITLIHTGEGIYSQLGILPNQSWSHLNGLGYTFMVPVFFILSGFFAQKSTKKTGARVQNLLTNLVFPYAVWTLIQATLIIVSGAGNNHATWSELPLLLIDGWMQFWFLHCLILIVAIDIILRSLRVSQSIRICGALVITSATMINFEFPWKLQAVAEHIIYFEIGVALSIAQKTIKLPINAYHLAFCGAILLEAFYMSGARYEEPLRPLGALSGVALCFSLAIIISKSSNLLSRFLNKCGHYSLQIYLVHIIIAASVRVLLFKLGIESFGLHLILGFTISLLGSILIGYADERTLNTLFRFPFIKTSPPPELPTVAHEPIEALPEKALTDLPSQSKETASL